MSRRVDQVWMKVTLDKYELPELICDSVEELAEKCNTKPEYIWQARSRAKKRGGRCRYKRVVLEGVEDE